MIQILNLSFPVKLVSRLLVDINPILLLVSGRLSPHNFEMYSIRPYQVYAFCHGVDTADVLEQGLSRRAIALGSLKGLIGTKDTREFLY